MTRKNVSIVGAGSANFSFGSFERFKMAKSRRSEPLIPTERIEQSILLVRGQKVLLDSALAGLYGVETKVLNQAVKRNSARFPGDFMFQLTREEFENLKSQ
ncbi:MAG: ORF6N domain-containing protein, partial [Candidatus Hydrogenedentales bacterium]